MVLIALGMTLGLTAGFAPVVTAPAGGDSTGQSTDTAVAPPGPTHTDSPPDTRPSPSSPETRPDGRPESVSDPISSEPLDASGAVPEVIQPPVLPVGGLAANPVTGRREIVVEDVQRTAVLIGDSQAAGADTWPQLALTALGYSVSFAGAGGTGFVATNPDTGAPNYLDSLTGGIWVLPHGDPALVVVQGGGNDAGTGVGDEQILANATTLLRELERTYPSSRVVMIGTLSRSAVDGGGRRSEVDVLLRGLAEAKGIPFISAGDWLTSYRLKDFLADQVHLTPEGHARAADVLAQNLRTLKLDASYTSDRLSSAQGDRGATE